MKVMKQSSTIQLTYWKALFAHISCVIQVILELEIVAGIGMASRNVVSRISSGTQAITSGRIAEERGTIQVLLHCAYLKCM